MHSHDTPVPQWWPCFRHVFFFLRMFRRLRRAVGHCNLWQLHGRCRVSKVDGMVTLRRSTLQRSWHEDLQLSGIVDDYWLLSLVPALKKYISFMVLDLEKADILVRVRSNLMILGRFWVTMSWFIFWFGLVVLESYHPSDKFQLSPNPKLTLQKTVIQDRVPKPCSECLPWVEADGRPCSFLTVGGFSYCWNTWKKGRRNTWKPTGHTSKSQKHTQSWWECEKQTECASSFCLCLFSFRFCAFYYCLWFA